MVSEAMGFRVLEISETVVRTIVRSTRVVESALNASSFAVCVSRKKVLWLLRSSALTSAASKIV